MKEPCALSHWAPYCTFLVEAVVDENRRINEQIQPPSAETVVIAAGSEWKSVNWSRRESSDDRGMYT